MGFHSRLIRYLSIAVPAAILAIASPASAAAPTGAFANFGECPLGNPAVNECVFAQTTSGEVAIRSTSVPIVKTITLQGGLIVNEEVKPETETFVEAANGETLSKTPQPVPGGLVGLIKCEEIKGFGLLEDLARATCKTVFENGLTGANATTELVATPTLNDKKLAEGVGTALTLPVRIHLENPLLGSECYIGSKSEPVTLNLTDGKTSPPSPNEPIEGKLGEVEFEEEGALLVITGNTLVDNSFAVPTAHGCGGLLAIVLDPVIDAKLGLPSPAGNNTAILNNKLEQAAAEAVVKSEP